MNQSIYVFLHGVDNPTSVSVARVPIYGEWIEIDGKLYRVTKVIHTPMMSHAAKVYVEEEVAGAR
jgi:hypothetical protein